MPNYNNRYDGNDRNEYKYGTVYSGFQRTQNFSTVEEIKETEIEKVERICKECENDNYNDAKITHENWVIFLNRHDLKLFDKNDPSFFACLSVEYPFRSWWTAQEQQEYINNIVLSKLPNNNK